MNTPEIQVKSLIPKRRTRKRTCKKVRSSTYLAPFRPTAKRRGFPPLGLASYLHYTVENRGHTNSYND